MKKAYYSQIDELEALRHVVHKVEMLTELTLSNMPENQTLVAMYGTTLCVLTQILKAIEENEFKCKNYR